MSIHRYAARKDRTHDEVVARFRAAGCTVHNWGVDGAPDIVVGIRGVTILVEVKDGTLAPSKRRLTPKQDAWHRTWRGAPVVIVECPEDVGRVLSMWTSEGQGQVR